MRQKLQLASLLIMYRLYLSWTEQDQRTAQTICNIVPHESDKKLALAEALHRMLGDAEIQRHVQQLGPRGSGAPLWSSPQLAGSTTLKDHPSDALLEENPDRYDTMMRSLDLLAPEVQFNMNSSGERKAAKAQNDLEFYVTV
eukprot:Clim_evm26s166 gene=Clim_evmTU26s166